MPKRGTTWIRRIIKILLYAVALIFLCAALLFAYLQTGPGKRTVTNLVVRLLAEQPFLQARIEGVRGFFPFRLEVESFELHDTDGLWLKADRTRAQLSVKKLLRGKVLLPEVAADRLHVLRPPRIDERDPEEGPAGSVAEARIPPIVLPSITIDRLVLDPALTGIRIDCSLVGRISIWEEPGVIQANAEVAGLLDGDGLVDVRLDLGGGELAIDAETDLTKIAWNDFLVHDPAANLALTVADAGVEMRIEASGRWQELSATAVTECAYGEATLRIESMDVDTPIGGATGRGQFDMSSRLFSGEVNVDIPDLAKVAPLVGLEAQGRISGRLEMAGRDGLQAVLCGVRGSQIRGAWGSVETVDASVDIADLFGLRDVSVILRGEGFERGISRVGVVDVRSAIASWERSEGNILRDGSVDFVAHRLSHGEIAVDEARLAARFDRGVLEDFASMSGGVITGSVSGVARGDLRADSLHAVIEADAGSLRIAADAEGWVRTNVTGRLTASVTRQDQGWRAEVTGFDAVYREHDIRLDSAAVADFSSDGLHVTHLAVRFDDALLEATGQFQSNRLDVVARTQDVRIDAIPFPALGRTAGTLSAELSVTGTPRDPVGELRGELRGFRMTEGGLKHLPAVHVRWDTALADGEVSADVHASTEEGDRLYVNARLPVHVSLSPPNLSWLTNQHAAATLTTELQLSTLNRLPLLSEQRVGGRVTAELRYEGSDRKGDVTGYCRIRDGSYEHFTFGTVLKEIEIDLVGNADRLELRSATAGDGGAGRIEASGSLDVTPYGGFDLNFEAGMQRVRLARLDAFTATTSGTLLLTGTVTRMHVNGNITVDEALLDLDLLPPSAPPALEDFDLAAAAESNGVQATTLQTEGAGALTGRVKIGIPPEFTVRGPGLDSRWQGEFLWTLGEDGPRLTGRVEPRRGTYAFLGRRFDLRGGEIDVGGAWPPVPLLNLRADHRRPDMTAILHVRGPATDPRFDLTSDPPYPPDEVLSRVLFGRSAGMITGLQALELAAAVRSMHSGRPAGGLLQRTKEALSVDQLSVVEQGEAGAGQASLVVGKRLSDRVYVEINQGFNREGTIATIEYEIRRNLNLETDTGNARLNPGIGINWRKDY